MMICNSYDQVLTEISKDLEYNNIYYETANLHSCIYTKNGVVVCYKLQINTDLCVFIYIIAKDNFSQKEKIINLLKKKETFYLRYRLLTNLNKTYTDVEDICWANRTPTLKELFNR